MSALARFFMALTVLAGLLAGGLVLWNQFGPPQYRLTAAYFLLAGFYLVTLLVHSALIKAGEKNAKTFVNSFMAVTGLKMFVYLLGLVIYVFVVPKSAFVFAFHFLVFYFVFTVFEVTMLMRFFKRNG